MICPRCGSKMVLDEHRKVPFNMCYECGYTEGRANDHIFNQNRETNFKHLKELNFNETIAFLSKGLEIDEGKLFEFLDEDFKR